MCRLVQGVALLVLLGSGPAEAFETVARDDHAVTARNVPVLLRPIHNDYGDWVSASLDVPPAHGSLIGSGGAVWYVPEAGFLGTDQFTYSLLDQANVTVAATTTIEVMLPWIKDDSARTTQNFPVTISPAMNDVGEWATGSFGTAANGTVTAAGPLLVEYTPEADFVGTDQFTYSLTDGSGTVVSGTVTVGVDLPLARDDFALTGPNTPVLIPVFDNDTGTWISGSLGDPSDGTVQGGGGGATLYTPDPGFQGVDTFTYSVTDQGGTESQCLVAVIVAPPTVGFVDVTAAAGLGHVQHALADPPNASSIPMPAYMSGGAAAGDFDGDGWIDLYVTRFDAPDILYRNTGLGGFEDATAVSGIDRDAGSNGAGWADIDGDGDLDLYVTSLFDNRHYLYVNDGTGVFTEEATARGAAVESPDEHFGFGVAFGDYDGDGYVDIHTTEWRSQALNPTLAKSNARLLRNLGVAAPGSFEDVTEAAGVALDGVVGGQPGTFSFSSRFSDLDGDGSLDLVVAGDFGTSRLFWNQGDGTFVDGTESAGVGTDENGMGNTVGDFDGDGLLDWFVTSIFDPARTCEFGMCNWGYTGNRLFRNNGDRTFTDATDDAGVRNGYWGWGAAFFDYDNDGDLDLVHTNGFDLPLESAVTLEDLWEADPMRLWDNDGQGVYAEASSLLGVTDTAAGKGLLVFDYDRDGDQDLLVINNGGAPVLYRNDGGNQNDWLRVATVGATPGNGLRVAAILEQGGPVQVREIAAGNNFLGQDEPVAHLGLGAGSAPVHEVTVTWPDGAVQVFSDVPPRTTLLVDRADADAP